MKRHIGFLFLFIALSSIGISAEERDLHVHQMRRAYDGAPPIVPHEVTPKMNCLQCHEKGGYVAKFSAYTPITPHPTWSQCSQCHVPKNTTKLFKNNLFGEWEKLEKTIKPSLKGAPLLIPHQAFTRQDCLACHGGPAAPPEIRTTHPERVMCTQCHVYQKGLQKGQVQNKINSSKNEKLKTVVFQDSDEKELLLVERTQSITQFPCSSCHNQNYPIPSHIKSPHGDIWKHHGQQEKMDCFTCHNKDNRDTLHSPFEPSISFNEAPKLCYSCHGQEYKDWLHGAHGKRINTWNGERVILSCTECHNPHQPEFPQKIAKTSGVQRRFIHD